MIILSDCIYIYILITLNVSSVPNFFKGLFLKWLWKVSRSSSHNWTIHVFFLFNTQNSKVDSERFAGKFSNWFSFEKVTNLFSTSSLTFPNFLLTFFSFYMSSFKENLISELKFFSFLRNFFCIWVQVFRCFFLI